MSAATIVAEVFAPTFGKSKRRIPPAVETVSTLKTTFFPGFWSPSKKTLESVNVADQLTVKYPLP